MDGREYLMSQEINQGIWQVREVRTGRMHEFKQEELHKSYADGKLVFLEHEDKSGHLEKAFVEKSNTKNRNIEDKEWDKAVLKRMYVKAVEHLPCTQSVMEPEIQKVWTNLKLSDPAPHWTTVSRWKKKYLENGKDAFALASEHQRKGNRSERIHADVVEIAENCIDKIYMRRERGTIEDTVEEATVMVSRENKLRPVSCQLPEPTRRLINV